MKTTDFTDFEILESFENVWIANYNCPGQIVITGLTNEVQQASLALKEAGAKRVVELKSQWTISFPAFKTSRRSAA